MSPPCAICSRTFAARTRPRWVWCWRGGEQWPLIQEIYSARLLWPRPVRFGGHHYTPLLALQGSAMVPVSHARRRTCFLRLSFQKVIPPAILAAIVHRNIFGGATEMTKVLKWPQDESKSMQWNAWGIKCSDTFWYILKHSFIHKF